MERNRVKAEVIHPLVQAVIFTCGNFNAESIRVGQTAIGSYEDLPKGHTRTTLTGTER